jgi:polygalacturonase
VKSALPASSEIHYEGPNSKNPLAFKPYSPGEIVEGKTLCEHLRVAFEFIHKLGAPYHCWHDRDVDAFARGLKIAAAIRKDGRLAEFVKNRYTLWDSGSGAKNRSGQSDNERLGSPHAQAGRSRRERQRPPGISRKSDERVYMKRLNLCSGRVRIVFILIALFTAASIWGADVALRAPKVAAPVIPKNNVDLADFGRGDGKMLNTAAFENAFAALAGKGGGTLVVPPGIWLTGPIKLRSHTELHVERGALIQFFADYHLYPLVVIDLKGEKEVDSVSPISGVNLENIAITGEGIIDGGGDAWRPLKKDKLGDRDWKALVKSGGVLNEKGDTWYPSRDVITGEKLVEKLRGENSLKLEDYEPAHQFLRPKMLRLIGCKKVLLEGVTFQNPPNWTMNPVLCEDVSIRNVSVHNLPTAQNSDALDLESCRRAIIRGCTFDTGDDGICIKSGKDAAGRRIGVPCEDVLVEDCTVYHAHGGFTIGSEMSGGVRNFIVRNCTFIGTDIGLRFKSTRGRGGVVENIYVSDIRMEDIPGDAINFNLYYGGKSPLDETAIVETNLPPVTEATPQFRNIHLENILCRGAENAIVLQGLPEMPLRDITLKNVAITSQKGVSVTDAENISFENVRVENQAGEALKTCRVKNCRLDLTK